MQTITDRHLVGFASDVRRDLALTPKQLQSKYLYDALGSSLFEAICRLPWYAITRSETHLLEKSATTPAWNRTDPLSREGSRVGPYEILRELGSGGMGRVWGETLRDNPDVTLAGWFDDIRVQVRQNFLWIDVKSLTVAPNYPDNARAGSNTTYTFSFADTWGDGVRIIGTPGGVSKYTSFAELEIYFSR